MKLKSVWLIVLLMLTGAAAAANVNFNGGAVGGCTLSGNTYSCASIPLGATDFAVIASGYTVVVSGNFTPSYHQGLTMSGTAALQSGGSINLSNINPSNVSTGGATLSAGGSFVLGSSTTINGSVNAASIDTGSGNTITGSVSVSGLADLGSAIKINGDLSAGSVRTGSPGTIGGSITSATTVAIGSGLTVGGGISGTTITTTSPVTLNGAINASVAFTLASGSSVTGNISSPKVTLNASNSTVKGDITTTGTLEIGSGNTVNGIVKAATLNMNASGAVINGAVTVSGDVDMESGSTINGDLKARNVTTHSGSAVINGNAAVNAIYIDWNNSVTGTITCTGALNGTEPCSCVSKPQYYAYTPRCGAASGGAPHHFQINHNGVGLTCQPQTVTVTACANANCTAPHYTSDVDVTLQPGGKTFKVSGGVNSAATVEASVPNPYTLSASATGVNGATTCVNSGAGPACEMVFKKEGLVVTASYHVAMTSGAQVTIEAKKAQDGYPSCVPLVQDKTLNVNMACAYSDPVNAVATPVKMGAASATCGNGSAGNAVSVPFSFNSAGVASVPLEYAEVGKVGLDASLSTAGFLATGNGAFIAAPARLLITATNAAGVSIPNEVATAPATRFAKASEPFSLSISAVNSQNVVSRNFGKESNPTKVKIGWTMNNPADAGANGQLTVGAFAPFDVAGKSSAAASFSDVGYLTLKAELVDTYYMGTQLAIFQTKGQQYVSRFVPDHFDTVLLTNDEINAIAPNIVLGRTMSCAQASVKPCAAGAGDSFINSRQPFFVKVLAYNGANAPTLNYAGSLARKIELRAMAVKGGAPAKAAAGTLGWGGETNGATPTRYSFTKGVGALANPGPIGPNLPAFSFSSAYPAADIAPATIYLRAIDADNVSSRRAPDSDPADAPSSVEAPLTVVSGRLLVANSNGSPDRPLPVQVYAQYYMPGGYVFNAQEQGAGNGALGTIFNYSNCQKKLDDRGNCRPLTLVNPSAPLVLKNGRGTFRIAPPSSPSPFTGIGSADVKLSITPPLPAAPTNHIDYLPSTTGRETFGVYRSGPVVYRREVYN
ncbi:MSHA biogenesis protein MshQ [Duganella sp. SG902]|uniref:DUF6701 domain-containing protein n=1 Tax=Duganella sp. SG902 TaxID=2587016 RepID=UPI00159D44F8|nr:DUF6701 domain-containing protein [Duganella sp. SG902]NVM75726.1 MSHA biogenesis protein MshQ [Duganella sp. SG902]